MNIATKAQTEPDSFLFACSLLRIKAITGEECLALTGASQKEVVGVINSDQCKQLAIRIQTDGLAHEVAAQLDLYRAQLKLRERLDDPELGTAALLAISQFLFSIGGMKERRQVRVAEASGPRFSIVQIFDTDPPELVAQKRLQAADGIVIHLPSALSSKNSTTKEVE
jgi:hypothetical protein